MRVLYIYIYIYVCIYVYIYMCVCVIYVYIFLFISAIPSSSLIHLDVVSDDAGLCCLPHVIMNSFVLGSTKFSLIPK